MTRRRCFVAAEGLQEFKRYRDPAPACFGLVVRQEEDRLDAGQLFPKEFLHHRRRAELLLPAPPDVRDGYFGDRCKPLKNRGGSMVVREDFG